METKWTYCVMCAIIQIHFLRGVWEETINAGEDVYALPGSEVNLTCQTRKTAFLVQMQWSKVPTHRNLIAVYHPQHGFCCAKKSPCESLVSFTEMPHNVLRWTLHLRNLSSSLSGKYECSFTLYPEGTWTKIYNLFVQTSVAQDEWRSNHTIEIEINGTLKIPCFQNLSSEISSDFTFAWLVETNGTQELLINQDHVISNSTLFKDRIQLGPDHGLHLSPVQIDDDDRKFSCLAAVGPGTSFRSTTTVKVFAKPEIPTMVGNYSVDGLEESTFTCVLRNVFPTANLTWFVHGGFLQGEKEEICITNEARKGKGGCSELKSVLTRAHINESAQSNNVTIWCAALFPVPGNKVRSISSEKISFSFGSVNPPTDPPLSVMESTLNTQYPTANSGLPTTYPATSSITPADVSTSTPDATHQISNSSMTTQGFNNSWTSRGGDDEQSVSWLPSERNGLPPSEAHSTFSGAEVNKPKDGMSWPVIVAALLFSCMVCFGLGLRKWCQYQKEILQRPPPFKPPPPPIKYTCIQDPLGRDVPYHEMETL
ncbi:T-cell surface protein tactile [Echinops telfairi]|uniref:T-cell surface protein tactile n=1 Tax=Echinops telfairi TaxID=9371 RepID=A0AC55CQC7_ECHTE|nr:T-cell surface protein tactile [Echinops telfairi]